MNILNKTLYDVLLTQAAENPRRRQHYDLRNSVEDESQRMLNAIWPDSVIPIHRHQSTSETVVVLKGCVEEVFYNDKGVELERIRMDVSEGCQVPQGTYHTAVALEPSVIIEFKAGRYNSVTTEDFLVLWFS